LVSGLGAGWAEDEAFEWGQEVWARYGVTASELAKGAATAER
jgi:hypothetical protein